MTAPDNVTEARVGGPRPVRNRLLASARRPPVTVALAVATVVAVVGIGQLSAPGVDAAPAVPVPEPVAAAELVCPVTTASAGLVSTISAGVAPLPTVKDGVATLADLTTAAASSEPLLVTAPGKTVTRTVSGKTGPAQLARATGSFAGGFGADQMIRSGQGSTRGLAATPCARPVTDAWLVGGGSTVGRLSQVLLVNDDDSPATVDLTVYGTGGPIDSSGGSELTLPPSSRTQVRLDTRAPNQSVFAVHVEVTTGRVGVTGLDQASYGLVPLGMSLLPSTHPGTDVVVPFLPGGLSGAYLELLAPEVDATASVQLLTPDGALTPVGLDQVSLHAGRVTVIPLAPALAGAPAGVVVRSDTPVVAGVEVGIGAGALFRERDAAAGTPALTAPGLVVGLAGGALRHIVGLAAPAAAAEVRLDLYSPGTTGTAWTSTVTVPEGGLTTVTVPVAGAGATSTLVVTPLTGGPVYAERQVVEAGPRGPMIALAPIYPTRATTLVPVVASVPGSSVAGSPVR
ncbi:MAG TPA: DUF5719 family protein [Candidatus Angelobacter sp.]|nr:DUF5719 family protein [Candidatus Angelobacter sp.]